jgi:hypothetical protein
MDRAKLIDEYGELCRQLDEIKPVILRHKELGSMLQSWYVDAPADQPATAQGRLYTLQISPRDNQTTITDIRKVYRVLGVSRFLELCSITLKAVKENVTPKVYEGLIETHRTGFRTLKTVLRAPAKQGTEAA